MLDNNIIYFNNQINSFLDNKRVKSISFDHEENIWLGTKSGIYVFNKNKQVKTFNEKNGLANNRIRKLFEDKEGNIWIGTYYGGLLRYQNDDLLHYNENHGLTNNQVNAIFEDENNHILIGTNNGVNKLKNGRVYQK